MPIQILLLFVTQLVLPLYFVYSLWKAGENSKFAWLLKVLYSAAFLGYNTLLNYHNSSASQQYALDVVELNTAGARAAGIYPTVLERYEIFEETTHFEGVFPVRNTSF